MIAQNPLYPVTLPAPAKQHPDYCELRELLTRLSPAYPVYVHITDVQGVRNRFRPGMPLRDAGYRGGRGGYAEPV